MSSHLTQDDRESLSETQEEAVEWADRNDYGVFKEEQSQGIWLKIKVGESRYVIIDPYDNVVVEKSHYLGGEAGSVSFGEKRLTVENDRGERWYVSRNSFPV